jgi:hypothetical protein
MDAGIKHEDTAGIDAFELLRFHAESLCDAGLRKKNARACEARLAGHPSIGMGLPTLSAAALGAVQKAGDRGLDRLEGLANLRAIDAFRWWTTASDEDDRDRSEESLAGIVDRSHGQDPRSQRPESRHVRRSDRDESQYEEACYRSQQRQAKVARLNQSGLRRTRGDSTANGEYLESEFNRISEGSRSYAG